MRPRNEGAVLMADFSECDATQSMRKVHPARWRCEALFREQGLFDEFV